MKLTWATDVHLDFIDGPDETGRVDEEFAAPLSRVAGDGVVLSGDISLADSIVRHLRIIDRVVNKPIFFVLGNHDFYNGEIEAVRREVSQACAESRNLNYLTRSEPFLLTKKVALVGHDGWYDAYHGDAQGSPYVMSDWFKIMDFVNAGAFSSSRWSGNTVNKGIAIALARKLSNEAAVFIEEKATVAANSREVVVIVTHVPPFPEAHLHDGRSGSQHAMPWYTSKLMGDAILRVAAGHPNNRFEVFCGHTHSHCDTQVADNVFCHVGGSDYGNPRIAGTIRLA
jgi:3',5'-cyclic-AMP phosphodiesterase